MNSRSKVWLAFLLVAVAAGVGYLAIAVVPSLDSGNHAPFGRDVVQLTSPRSDQQSKAPVSSVKFDPNPSPAAISTADRRRVVYDGPDALVTVRGVQASGTGDDRGWAAELMSRCRLYVPTTQRSSAGMSTSIAKMVDASFDELRRRCGSINALAWPEWIEILAKLSSDSSPGDTEYGRLSVIQDRQKHGDARLSTVEIEDVSRALCSEDVVLKQQSALVLLGLFDSNSSGGAARTEAIVLALGHDLIDQPTTEFERLEDCAQKLRCGQDTTPTSVTPSGNEAHRREVERFRRRYVDALAKCAGVDVILGVR